jgi:hypothetical protein
MLAATATVGLRTGSLWPLFPMVTRKQTPVWFWVVIAAMAAIVILNLVRLLWGALAR